MVKSGVIIADILIVGYVTSGRIRSGVLFPYYRILRSLTQKLSIHIVDELSRAMMIARNRISSSNGITSSNYVPDEAGQASQGYIDHKVSKLDTLAGIAIKYGVEVADVKRANGLSTDFQMFAHKTLKIPVGRQCTITAHKSEPRKLNFPSTPKSQAINSDAFLGSSQNLESRYRDRRCLTSAMSLLRGYYGLSSPAHYAIHKAEGMEMTPYQSDAEEHSEEEPFSPITGPVLGVGSSSITYNECRQVKKECSRLGVVGYSARSENVALVHTVDVQKANFAENSVRRRSKVDVYPNGTSDLETYQDSGVPFLSIDRPNSKVARMANLLNEPLLGAKAKEVPILKVIKSSSASNLQEQAASTVDSVVPRYGGKSDVKSSNPLNQVAARSLFESFPKPPAQRHKTALD